jgi:hypothetical protein
MCFVVVRFTRTGGVCWSGMERKEKEETALEQEESRCKSTSKSNNMSCMT